jgi:soluble lytic murein transglycosylase-like protein
VAGGIPTPLVAPHGYLNQEVVQCVANAAQYYQVPELLLHALLQKERGRVGQAVRDANGSYDLGLAQINTVWASEFARFGITPEQIRDDPCTNLYAAGYVLRLNVNHYGGNDWYRATMAYHAGSSGWRNPTRYRIAYSYASDVIKRWWVLQHRVFGDNPAGSALSQRP